MEIIYTLTRPNTEISFSDRAAPGYVEFLIALFESPGIDNNIELSKNGLKEIVTFVFDEPYLSLFDEILENYAEVRAVQNAYRERVGVKITKKVVQ